MIELIDVHKAFGDFQVHKGISLKIESGAITYIIGPSGTGKSVLLKQIMGLLQPDKGQVLYNGIDMKTFNKKEFLKIRSKFGMVFQNAALFDSMTVFENVAFPLLEHRRKELSMQEIKEIVNEKLKVVGLTNANEKYPYELSGGMKKRAGLARALALSPEVILYDEPTTGLDPIMTDVVDHLISSTQKTLNITSIVISHDIPSVMKNADYIAMIYDGYVVLYGTPDDFEKTDNPYVRQFFARSKDGPIKVY